MENIQMTQIGIDNYMLYTKDNISSYNTNVNSSNSGCMVSVFALIASSIVISILL